jgi:hypothetical protein
MLKLSRNGEKGTVMKINGKEIKGKEIKEVNKYVHLGSIWRKMGRSKAR